jgi:hypothetical protein
MSLLCRGFAVAQCTIDVDEYASLDSRVPFIAPRTSVHGALFSPVFLSLPKHDNINFKKYLVYA